MMTLAIVRGFIQFGDDGDKKGTDNLKSSRILEPDKGSNIDSDNESEAPPQWP